MNASTYSIHHSSRKSTFSWSACGDPTSWGVDAFVITTNYFMGLPMWYRRLYYFIFSKSTEAMLFSLYVKENPDASL